MPERIDGLHGSYLVQDQAITKGGVGSIHRTDDPRWVFKRYLKADKAPRAEDLGRLVAIGQEVLVRTGAEIGSNPETSVNWPVDLVVDHQGLVTGTVLPAIPDTLFNEHKVVRTLEFLLFPRSHPPLAKGRVALLLRMAEILNFVHARGLVHGDINGKNLAWSLVGQRPVMYLIDCDGMVPQDPPPTVGVQAMSWTDPRVFDKVVPAHDHYSDWYALALAMYRGLLLTPGNLEGKDAAGRWKVPQAIPPELDERLTTLLKRALADPLNAEGRPRPEEWVKALVSVYVPQGHFDTQALQVLDGLSAPKVPPKPAPQPDFIDLPRDDDYDRGRGGTGTKVTSPPVIRRPPPGRPPAPTPPRVQPIPRIPPPAPRPQPVPPISPHVPTPRQNYRPIGGLAMRALDGGLAWHVKGLLVSTTLSLVAVIYIAVALVQLRRVPASEPRLASRKIALYVYLGIALLMPVLWSLSTLSSSPSPSPYSPTY